MKINFSQKFNQNTDFLIRRCGYGQIRDSRTGQTSYVRRLRSDFYPRFHLYINSEKPLVLNLHLDQKKASYEGQTAHSGDYDSDLVKQEGQRIYNQILAEDKEAASSAMASAEEEKRGFFARLFGK
ncbi:MAG: hypothetical protein A2Y82_02230 [Candidatus Buchananbacteria bacterium RBG_13_36_9]|uniref:Uncharacterized protein n=1 Tax=Candidatus Buchananbacteria bacterium RBG_13_36_9 TaxID=1797530 RepID=A0A1G1XM60_9BACT|nr:MAG: hypothetical protein A2Y82_02230 [Candidatus Buchananbacteria bacterium RBG_13_36_9]